MIAITRRVGVLFLVIVILCSIEIYGKEVSGEITTEKVSDKTSTPSGDSATSEPSSETKKSSKSPSLISYDKLHKVLREERTGFSLDIDKQRKETHAYLTQERRVILDELKSELRRITELIESERAATMVEMEEIGNSVADNAILNSKQLIDYLFYRMMQFAAVTIISLIILGLIIYGIIAKKNKQSHII